MTWHFCKSCLMWIELPDDIQIQVLRGGKGVVFHEGKAHYILTGRQLESMKIKHPPPVTPVESKQA